MTVSNVFKFSNIRIRMYWNTPENYKCNFFYILIVCVYWNIISNNHPSIMDVIN